MTWMAIAGIALSTPMRSAKTLNQAEVSPSAKTLGGSVTFSVLSVPDASGHGSGSPGRTWPGWSGSCFAREMAVGAGGTGSPLISGAIGVPSASTSIAL